MTAYRNIYADGTIGNIEFCSLENAVEADSNPNNPMIACISLHYDGPLVQTARLIQRGEVNV